MELSGIGIDKMELTPFLLSVVFNEKGFSSKTHDSVPLGIVVVVTVIFNIIIINERS